ncbi:MAG: PDZ domain-containing protein [Candidatus Eisenbacteria bacterium]|nr:PDZ domain-containing protein [Candidatus Eisenbacteria bacterium]
MHRLVAAWMIAVCAWSAALGASLVGSAAQAQSAWLGIYTEPVSQAPDFSGIAEVPAPLRSVRAALRVTGVFPGSPADEAGLLAGDWVVALAGSPFACPAESLQVLLRREVAKRKPGDPLELTVVRDAQRRDLRIDNRLASPDVEERFWRAPAGLLDSLPAPARVEARVEKKRALLVLSVTLGISPEEQWGSTGRDAALFPEHLFPENEAGPAFRLLSRAYGFENDNLDLLARLAACHASIDPYRNDWTIQTHRSPFRFESLARHVAGTMSNARCALDIVLRGSLLLSPALPLSLPANRRLPPLQGAVGEAGQAGTETARLADAHAAGAAVAPAHVAALADVIGQALEVFEEAKAWHDLAFRALTPEERAFLAQRRWELPEAFAEEIYLHLDSDARRFRDNQRLIEIAALVDQQALGEAAARLALLCDPAWARAAGARIRQALGDSADTEIILDYASPYGRFLIGGTAGHWYREQDVAFLLDLGGDDLYTGNAGAAASWELPLAVAIDLEGDDAYEATGPAAQGSGCLGVGGLVDLAGDDEYLGVDWCQGTGYFGIGWLHDLAGDDVYRGRSYCQGVGLFGQGTLLDSAGDDRYEAHSHAQALGLPRGLGTLADAAGDDGFYAKGLHPTGYGDPGIFDSWSQGCGLGFRTLASGGVGLLLDGGGRDRMEAGNFSQGGGYYYGFGLVQALGNDPDLYIGSRYNQGFSAHQAIGAFLEEGGDDRYTTRQGVAQGLAWDECVTLFIDAAGNDRYEGGGFFSQGAAAHNSIALFFDRSGDDEYRYAPGQARAGGNEYHGGTSFALFVDEGGGRDRYLSSARSPGGAGADEAGNDTLRYEPQHGVAIDLAGRFSDWLADSSKSTTEEGGGRPGDPIR